MDERTLTKLTATGGLKMNQEATNNLTLKNIYEVVCLDSEGKEKWREEVQNLVVDTGLNDILDKYWKGSTYSATHYVGLMKTGTTVAAADTMSTHTGWAESADYTESVRQTLTLGTVASKSVDNTASKAEFSINATVTITGAFITTSNTKSGTAGTLIGAVAFGSSRAVISGDTLQVTCTLTAASA